MSSLDLRDESLNVGPALMAGVGPLGYTQPSKNVLLVHNVSTPYRNKGNDSLQIWCFLAC